MQGYDPHTADEFAFILEGEMMLAVVDKNGNTKENILKKGIPSTFMRDINTLKCHGNKECISIWSYLAPPCFPEDILLSTRNKIKIKTDKKTAAVKGAVFLS